MKMVHLAPYIYDYRPFLIRPTNLNCVADWLQCDALCSPINQAPPNFAHSSSPCAPSYRNYYRINSDKQPNWYDKNSLAKYNEGNCFVNATPNKKKEKRIKRMFNEMKENRKFTDTFKKLIESTSAIVDFILPVNLVNLRKIFRPIQPIDYQPARAPVVLANFSLIPNRLFSIHCWISPNTVILANR